MKPSSYVDYKKYLFDLTEKNKTRGFKASLAKAAGCQPSFLSQVLKGSAHLTLEHAVGISLLLKLSSTETEYFYCLIGSARAATPSLRGYYAEKMRLLKGKGDSLTERLDRASLKTDLIAEYYSKWEFAAVHMICTIPKRRSLNLISKSLGLAAAEASHVLEKLEDWGLVEKKMDEWVATRSIVHLPKAHFMTAANHGNWQRKCAEINAQSPDRNLAYTSVYSMSLCDFEVLKDMTVEYLNSSRKLVASSDEEILVAFTLDCTMLT